MCSGICKHFTSVWDKQRTQNNLLSGNEAFYNLNLFCFFCLIVTLFHLFVCLLFCLFVCLFLLLFYVPQSQSRIINLLYLRSILIIASRFHFVPFRFRLVLNFFVEHDRLIILAHFT